MMEDDSEMQDLEVFLDWVEKWSIKSGMNDLEEFAGKHFRNQIKSNQNHLMKKILIRQLNFLETGLYTGYDGFVPMEVTINILESLAKDLIKLGWDRKLRQVKIKFSELRFYIENSSEEIEERISKIEKLENTN